MHVSNFCTPEEEFLPSESVRVNRDTCPRGNFLFERLQKVHHPNSIDSFSMIENDCSIQRPILRTTHPRGQRPMELYRRRNYDSRSQIDVRDHPHHSAHDSVWWIFSSDLFDEQGQWLHGKSAPSEFLPRRTCPCRCHRN